MRELDSIKSGTPHSLIELSFYQWKRIESKSIYVSDMMQENFKSKHKKLLYKNIEIGCEVNMRKRKGVSNGKHSQWRTPLLGNTIGN